jgi:hypothetical protein
MYGRLLTPKRATWRGFKFVAFVVPVLAMQSFAMADDEPRIGLGLSRLFRLGGSRHSSKPAPKPHEHDHDHDSDEIDIARVPSQRDRKDRYPDVEPADPAPFQPAVISPGFGEAPGTRIAARPKYSGPVTEADPILTRVGIARSDGGNSFALFVQVYADGTVIDTEGVHRLPLAQIKPILSVIRGHDFSRVRGHCGQPSADFIENVQMVVYDRSMGRLRAHAFSYAGDPKGCDPSVAHLHKAVDELIMKLASARSGEMAGTTSSDSVDGGLELRVGNGTSANSAVIVQEPVQSVTPASPAIVTLPSVPAQDVQSSQPAIVPRLPSASVPSPFAPVPGGTIPELSPPR